MFNAENLAFIRTQELADLLPYLKGSDLLEVGAGPGFQARKLASLGFKVSAVDLSTSSYSEQRVFPVVDYDGKHLPFPDSSFDVVFTSNVLEHVHDLPTMLAEMSRVLRPGGCCVHAMPTPAWRLWSSLSGYLDLLPFIVGVCVGKVQTTATRFFKDIIARLVPITHGKVHPALVELWAWRSTQWIKIFERNGFEVVRAEPMNLFYTGWCFLGRYLPIENRRTLARYLGSASKVYEIRRRVT